MEYLVKVNTFFVFGIQPQGAVGPNRAHASPEGLHRKGELAYFLTIGLTRAVTPIEAGRGWLAPSPRNHNGFLPQFRSGTLVGIKVFTALVISMGFCQAGIFLH